MFLINGVQVAEPAHQGVTITDEPIWAPNTGRAQDGTMTGDFVGWKRTVAVTWPPLSFDETVTIRNAIKNAGGFFQIQFTNDLVNPANVDLTSRGLASSITVYSSNLPRTIYSLADGLRKHEGVVATFIEQ